MKHVLTIDTFSQQDLWALFALTDQIRQNPKEFAQVLSGKLVATLFYEPSTRTRLSFEAAVQRLGGKIISTENARELSSAAKGENLRDTIRVVQGYVDAIVLRHYADHAAEEAATVAKVPLINAGSGAREHPTQALLDLYTVYSVKEKLDGLQYVLSGDLLYGRTVHSLVKMLAHLKGIKVYGLSLPEFSLPEEYVQLLTANQIPYIPCTKLEELPPSVDVIYHTRTQLERLPEKREGIKEIIIDRTALNHFNKETILLHPLPRNREITLDIDEDPRALYFKQAENGMYIRMAVLVSLFR